MLTTWSNVATYDPEQEEFWGEDYVEPWPPMLGPLLTDAARRESYEQLLLEELNRQAALRAGESD